MVQPRFLSETAPAEPGACLLYTSDIPWHGIWQWLTGATVDFHGFHLRISALLIAAATTVIMLKTRISFMYLLLVSAILGAFLCR